MRKKYDNKPIELITMNVNERGYLVLFYFFSILDTKFLVAEKWAMFDALGIIAKLI